MVYKIKQDEKNFLKAGGKTSRAKPGGKKHPKGGAGNLREKRRGRKPAYTPLGKKSLYTN
jgi:hypothetical protein